MCGARLSPEFDGFTGCEKSWSSRGRGAVFSRGLRHNLEPRYGGQGGRVRAMHRDRFAVAGKVVNGSGDGSGDRKPPAAGVLEIGIGEMLRLAWLRRLNHGRQGSGFGRSCNLRNCCSQIPGHGERHRRRGLRPRGSDDRKRIWHMRRRPCRKLTLASRQSFSSALFSTASHGLLTLLSWFGRQRFLVPESRGRCAGQRL